MEKVGGVLDSGRGGKALIEVTLFLFLSGSSEDKSLALHLLFRTFQSSLVLK